MRENRISLNSVFFWFCIPFCYCQTEPLVVSHTTSDSVWQLWSIFPISAYDKYSTPQNGVRNNVTDNGDNWYFNCPRCYIFEKKEPKGTDLFGSFLSLCLGIFRRPFTSLNMTNLFDNDNKFKANSNSHIVGDGVLDIPIKIITEGDISHRRYIEFQRNISQIPKEFISRITE